MSDSISLHVAGIPMHHQSIRQRKRANLWLICWLCLLFLDQPLLLGAQWMWERLAVF